MQLSQYDLNYYCFECGPFKKKKIAPNKYLTKVKSEKQYG